MIHYTCSFLHLLQKNETVLPPTKPLGSAVRTRRSRKVLRTPTPIPPPYTSPDQYHFGSSTVASGSSATDIFRSAVDYSVPSSPHVPLRDTASLLNQGETFKFTFVAPYSPHPDSPHSQPLDEPFSAIVPYHHHPEHSREHVRDTATPFDTRLRWYDCVGSRDVGDAWCGRGVFFALPLSSFPGARAESTLEALGRLVSSAKSYWASGVLSLES